MDLYRFFHPYFNPRVAKVPPRLFELEELKQVASLLRLSFERLEIRFERTENEKIHSHQMQELTNLMKCVEKIIDIEKESHTGDTLEEIKYLVKERVNLPGWENWARIISEGLANETLHELAQVNGLAVNPAPTSNIPVNTNSNSTASNVVPIKTKSLT